MSADLSIVMARLVRAAQPDCSPWLTRNGSGMGRPDQPGDDECLGAGSK